MDLSQVRETKDLQARIRSPNPFIINTYATLSDLRETLYL